MHLSNYYAVLALDIARERANEAKAMRLAALAEPGEPRVAGIRRAVARVAFAVARAADAEIGRTPVTSH